MTIREAIKEQRKSIKNRSLREQFAFFWEYYGIKTICLLLAVAALIAFIVTMVTKKDYAFTGVFFGSAAQNSAQSYLDAFGSHCGIDPEKYTCFSFGVGLERIALLKYEIDDMRLLYENDIRFLRQF